MYKKEDTISVCVYSGKKLIKQETFISLSSAHRFIENQTLIGNYCIMQRLENGRPWCTMKFWPKESI